jgi:hypothetical protein
MLVATTPSYISLGTAGQGTTAAVAYALPSSISIGSILYLAVESDQSTLTMTDQNGGTWTLIDNPHASTTCLYVWWSRYNGTQGNPTIGAATNHQCGRIIAYTGDPAATGNPYDVTVSNFDDTSNTTWSIDGLSTLVDGALVVGFVVRDDDSSSAHFSAWTNADLTSVTERLDGGTTNGNGGGYGSFEGPDATHGVVGATTVTNATATRKAWIVLSMPTFQTQQMTGSVTGRYFDLQESASAAIIKDSVSGQWLTLISNSSNNLQLYTSSDGETFSQVGSNISTNAYAAIGLCQDSNGAIHYVYLHSNAWSYGRMTLTRSGNTITGYTVATTFGLPSGNGSSCKCRFLAADGQGNPRIIFWGITGDDAGTWNGFVAHSGLTPASASQIYNLAGTANSWTTLSSHSQSSPGNWAPYMFNSELQPIGTAGNLYLTTGPGGRGDADNYASAVYGHLLVASGANWSESTVSTVGASSWESMLGSSCAHGGSMYQPYTYTPDGTTQLTLKIARIDSDGTVTSSIVSDLSYGPYGSEIETHMQVMEDGAMVIVGCCVDTWNSTNRVLMATYSGGAWSPMTEFGPVILRAAYQFPSRCGQATNELVIGCGDGSLGSTMYFGMIQYEILGATASSVLESGAFSPMIDANIIIDGSWNSIIEAQVLANGVWNPIVP